ncbi:hypothetical protein RHSIM_RhsimUnG0237600 [Rhododendron simsii]|uniref:Disease resistance N-terminal domain-containing protein n=1 Tax=Rhododendron simsii TaxID=118357 RepID=A0A834FTZ4_RHOSS|nr:hypothetical protein RHSIM_RhsimUnG0237600 [Rhododendron simsii]
MLSISSSSQVFMVDLIHHPTFSIPQRYGYLQGSVVTVTPTRSTFGIADAVLRMMVFEKLTSHDLWNFARRERIDTFLMKWSRMLEQIGSVLADAEEKQMTDQWGIKQWLEDLEDLA